MTMTLALALFCVVPSPSQASGVITTCTEAALRSAIVAGGLITFGCDGIIPLSSPLNITNGTTLDANGRHVQLDGQGQTRLLQVSTGIPCRVTGLRLVNGLGTTEAGAILNRGQLELSLCVLSNNVASGDGGAIRNFGTLAVVDSTFVNNRVSGPSVGAVGGAIATEALATLRIERCLFTANSAYRGSAIATAGIITDHAGLTNCTFSGNSALFPAGGTVHSTLTSPLRLNPILVRVVHCTFADNSEGSITGTTVPQLVMWAANSIAPGATALDAGGNLLANVDPRLASLADNGGPTPTRALLAGSPALDGAVSTWCTSTDQRGSPRPGGPGTACDIGAFESSDTPTPGLVRLATNSVSVPEHGGNATLRLARVGSSAPTVTVQFTVIPGTASPGEDYVGTNGVVTFAPGQTEATVAIAVLDNASAEADETFQVVFSNPTGGATLDGPATATVLIYDNDGERVVTQCDDASLRLALGLGRRVRFGCDGIIALTNVIDLVRSVELDGADRQVTVSGHDAVQIFTVASGVNVAMRNVTLAHGFSPVTGGAIRNEGNLALENCSFAFNVASAPGSSGTSGSGGAIQNYGDLRISGCTFRGNRASLTGSAIAHNFSPTPTGRLNVTNCTFAENISDSGSTLAAAGPIVGISNVLVHCTIAGNTGLGLSGAWTVYNSIIADNSGSGCLGPVTDAGHNLSADGSCGFTHPASRANTDPLLGPLAANGGPTLTRALLVGSPATDAANPATGPTIDQRGFPRPYGIGPDIGAFETTLISQVPGRFELVGPDGPIVETDRDYVFTVRRVGGAFGEVTVQFATSDLEAHANQDYQTTNGTLVFAPGQTARTFSVRVYDDALPEPTERLTVALSLPTGGATLGTPSSRELNILDDDTHVVVTGCNEASLRSAVASGQPLIWFDCDGVIRLTESLVITGSTRLDARGHQVTLSGSKAVRLFVVESNAFLGLHGLVLADGAAFGTNGDAGQPGAVGEGGAVLSRGRLEASECVFVRNQALGGRGGTSSFPPFGGAGGPGRGGAIFSPNGTVNLTNCVFDSNSSLGGAGTGRSPGGEAEGGAIGNDRGTFQLEGNVFRHNVANAGTSKGASGGAIYNAGSGTSHGDQFLSNRCVSGSTANARGGAIVQAFGTFEASGTTLAGNSALAGLGTIVGFGPVPGGRGLGGALALDGGTARLSACALIDNTARGGDGPYAGSAQGGAIYNGGVVAVTNCTVAANTARGGNAVFSVDGSGEGGGCYNAAEGTLSLIHVTIAGNTAAQGVGGQSSPTVLSLGGAVASGGGRTILRNSILANSLSSSNWSGTNLVDLGGNLSSDLSCPLSGPGSLVHTDPLLGPLWTYGALTPTHALLAGSPAIDAAVGNVAAPTPPIDQRGRPRPSGAASDIGAFESSPPYHLLGAVHGYVPPTGVEVTLNPGARTTTADSSGVYALPVASAGNYVVAPQAASIIFVPSNRVVSITADLPGVDFKSYLSNALVIERITGRAIRGVFAGEPGASYRVLSTTNLLSWTPWSTNTVETSGLSEFLAPGVPPNPPRFFQAVRP